MLNYSEVFFVGFFLTDIDEETSVKGTKLFFCFDNIAHQNSNCVLLKNNLTCSTFQKLYFWHSNSNVLLDFQQVEFFTHRIQYLFFIIFKSLTLFKSLIFTTVEIYKFHALINRNNEKTLQWSYNVILSKLQCDSFQLPN